MTNRIEYRGCHPTYGWFEVVKLSAVILSALVSMMALGGFAGLVAWMLFL